MVIVSAYQIPETVVESLERKGIDVVAPFSPDESPWEQQNKLANILKNL